MADIFVLKSKYGQIVTAGGQENAPAPGGGDGVRLGDGHHDFVDAGHGSTLFSDGGEVVWSGEGDSPLPDKGAGTPGGDTPLTRHDAAVSGTGQTSVKDGGDGEDDGYAGDYGDYGDEVIWPGEGDSRLPGKGEVDRYGGEADDVAVFDHMRAIVEGGGDIDFLIGPDEHFLKTLLHSYVLEPGTRSIDVLVEPANGPAAHAEVFLQANVTLSNAEDLENKLGIAIHGNRVNLGTHWRDTGVTRIIHGESHMEWHYADANGVEATILVQAAVLENGRSENIAR